MMNPYNLSFTLSSTKIEIKSTNEEKEIKGKKKQNNICFYQKKGDGIDILKNLMYSYTSSNQKSFNLSIDSLEQYE